ncbi:hypothetical protein P4O66_011464 [Electrophorus voltai]|uniref:SANT and BTB domain-containing protein n=1 Tax=Electrophorus voltai TaxID=2609070 RepID=A0AAD9DW36_9TELE|nr:hypothetical protein P4O66_011464 [Electrophorus voltai]
MNRLCSVNNNVPCDNNLLVLDMVLSSLWAVPQPVNWENVARLVPGFTPKECARRFDELKSTGSLPLVDDHCNMLTVTSGSPSEPLSAYIRSTLLDLTGDTAEPRTNQSVLSVSGLSVTPAERGCRAENEITSATEDRENEDGGKSPTMVIHVCDEAKNLKQDFECPRHLLVKEMRYFSEYLSMDVQRWEEVDISVHCDIQIFDWLMSYVKRNCEEPESEKYIERPKLEPSNVISILISSEFLKMDTLVEECIQFCHKHMSAVVATQCNMSCISSMLVSRITQLFTHNQAHDIKDKKDKFKRCSLCQKLLTKDTERKIPCVPGKLNVDSHGNIIYAHSRHKGWDVHEYLNSLYEELKSWVLVYWRIWGTINFLTCSCCKQVFLCYELAQCRYHPQPVVFPGVGAERNWHGTGFYPCCNRRALRFDPAAMPHGCKLRDHVVCTVDSEDCLDNMKSVQTRILNDLLLHRDVVCVSSPPVSESSVESPAGDVRVQDCNIMPEPGVLNVQRGREITAVSLTRYAIPFSLLKNWSLQLVPSRDSTPFTVSMQMSKWDSTRSLRFNQDAQREEAPADSGLVSLEELGKMRKMKATSVPLVKRRIEALAPKLGEWLQHDTRNIQSLRPEECNQRRMVEIIDHLTKMRFGDLEQIKSKDTKELAGGIYSRLEAQFKSCTQSSGKHNSSDKTLRYDAHMLQHVKHKCALHTSI